MRLVGLSGYARSGKDTAAELLIPSGYQRAAFADRLRTFAYLLNPVVGLELKNELFDGVRLADVIDEFGWDGYKSMEFGQEIRELIQRLGTECGRNLLGEDIWIRSLLDNLGDGKYAITDVRFPNEAEAIKSRGGIVVRIQRPKVGPANNHSTELSLEDYPFDYVVVNDGSLEDFQRRLIHTIHIAEENNCGCS